MGDHTNRESDQYESAPPLAWSAVDRAAAETRLRTAGVAIVPWPGRLQMAASLEADPDGLDEMHDPSWIYPVANGWRFVYAETFPGPGANDVSHFSGSFDELIDVALRWYQGSPAEIGGWLVPLHRHPEWDAARAAACISRARAVSVEESVACREIAAERRASYHRSSRGGGRVPWEQYMSAIFTPLHRSHPTAKSTLWLRRDLGEALIETHGTETSR